MKTHFIIFFLTLISVGLYSQPVIQSTDTASTDTAQIVSTPFTSNVDTSAKPSSSKHRRTEKIYNFNPWVDIPLTVATGGWSGYAFTYIYSKDPSTEEEIRNLDRNDIPAIDRWAAGMSSDAADANSNYLFYGSIPVPFALMLDKNIRKDAAKVSFMYLEAMSITGLFYTGSVYFVDRYRPETYDTTKSVEDRLGGNYKDAFLAGHPALVATSLFFTAKVFTDYHPGSPWNYAVYGAAIAGTGATAYLRHIAGKHFPTDLLTGVTVGTLCGILVPQFHKKKEFRKSGLTFAPWFDRNANGFAMAYRF